MIVLAECDVRFDDEPDLHLELALQTARANRTDAQRRAELRAKQRRRLRWLAWLRILRRRGAGGR